MNVKRVGDGAFYWCQALKDVYCHAEKVPNASYDIFNNLPLSEVTLHVPATSIEAYKSTQPWSGFGNIVAIEE